jgi:peptidoglycan/xylan/chitin deacetylase (PgdA/CDA1 family)/predicted N-acetyltransferase YhbS
MMTVSSAKKAYLTIDDGPREDFVKKADYLEQKGIRAIWFCMGIDLERSPEEAVYAIRQGHLIGNHSYDHPKFSSITLEEARDQILRTEAIIDSIHAAAGVPRTMKLFRFPYLDNGREHSPEHVEAIQAMLRELGFEQPHWRGITYDWYREAGHPSSVDVVCTYDTFDWCLSDGTEMFGYRDLPTILARMDEHVPEAGRGLNAPGSNEIVLMHAQFSFEAWQALIDKLLSKGLTFELPVDATIEIRTLRETEYEAAHAFQTAYLDQESYYEFVQRVHLNPDLYLAAFHGEEIIGVIYGHPSKRFPEEMNLAGVAVTLDNRKDFARSGIGTRLIRAFERAVLSRGCRLIGVGSADDRKVEQFYLRNGFEAIELVAKDEQYQELKRVAVDGYEAGLRVQKQLRNTCEAAEVIFIFKKQLREG